ncbi:centrosomal protein of 63 kDa isoform X2 [Ornithorhynchus anatinus]|uniref:centrosomal protein of 63 kDa isoform X2 n=1 Tax=Ornithorhynchus anatinus TaxID=9258 RepID=UPI0010A83098|nr:centrosomal protein of 63 kDa isoform X2 [Ornithorhynchus anatinus]
MEALLEGMQRRGQGGGFLTSCEAELQELMKQIDIMVALKRSEWEGQTQALETCLQHREQELESLRVQLDQKRKELARLKRNYEKLQKKQTRKSREGTRSQREDWCEMERLTGKLEEFRQKSLDWEKQRLIYQQKVASLEVQRKALTEESRLMQAQLTSWTQRLESTKLSNQSEIQHLTSKLERANDTICANELEIERLHRRVEDLVGTNKALLKDQQRIQEELRHSETRLEVLQEEKMELKATLRSQEDFINASRIQQEQLQNELGRVTETLHHKELISLESESATCKELSQELIEKHEELKLMEGYHDQCKAEMRKMKEQMLQAEQTYSCALDGMKMEVTQLTRELHQRDAAIEGAERKEAEHRVVLAQLETLRQENHHLSETLEKLESGVFRAQNFPPTDVGGGPLRMLGMAPRAILEGSVEARARPEEGATQTLFRERRDHPVDPMPSGGGHLDNAESRLTRRSHEYKEITKKPQTTDCDKIIQLYQGEIEALESRSSSAGREPGPSAVMGPSPQLSSSSSTVSLSSDFLLGAEALPAAPDDNEADSSDNGSEESGSNQRGEFLSLCPLPTSPIASIATRFLREEEWRSHHILERLNAHVEELKRESERTVRQYSQPK